MVDSESPRKCCVPSARCSTPSNPTRSARKGKYYDGKQSTCIECDELDLSEGVECTEKGVLLTTLPLLEGYWRANNASTIIRECLHGSACQGASVIQSSDDYCASGYEGPCKSTGLMCCVFLLEPGLVYPTGA